MFPNTSSTETVALLTLNPSVKNSTILKKRADSRTVDQENVNRKPKETQYKTIIETMEHFNMI